ncbi:hypothetical protein BsWGS_25013 [Bradybaena similaris]
MLGLNMAPLTPSMKIALGWSVIITVGLYGFIAARDSVIKNRKAIIDIKRKIKEQAQEEGEAAFKRKAELKQSQDSAIS